MAAELKNARDAETRQGLFLARLQSFCCVLVSPTMKMRHSRFGDVHFLCKRMRTEEERAQKDRNQKEAGPPARGN